MQRTISERESVHGATPAAGTIGCQPADAGK